MRLSFWCSWINVEFISKEQKITYYIATIKPSFYVYFNISIAIEQLNYPFNNCNIYNSML